jgi:hypothetical protein
LQLSHKRGLRHGRQRHEASLAETQKRIRSTPTQGRDCAEREATLPKRNAPSYVIPRQLTATDVRTISAAADVDYRTVLSYIGNLDTRSSQRKRLESALANLGRADLIRRRRDGGIDEC